MNGRTHIFIRIFFFLAACALLLSCGEKRPEQILSKPEMVRIMEEIYIAEEKVNQLVLSRDSATEVFSVIGQKVFDNASVTDSVFKKSFDYYMERPKDMELIYTALVDSLQLREQHAPFTNAEP